MQTIKTLATDKEGTGGSRGIGLLVSEAMMPAVPAPIRLRPGAWPARLQTGALLAGIVTALLGFLWLGSWLSF